MKLNSSDSYPSITSGKLDNGLQYYIKPLGPKSSKLLLNLYVKAGIDEQDGDQVSFGHFLEHMAFKSSKHAPEGLHNKLKKDYDLEMSQFDVNGHSGKEGTEYIFKANSNNKASIDAGLLWFEDIASKGLFLETNEIDKERGIYMQEYITRGGDNVEAYLNTSQLRYQLFPGAENTDSFFEHIKTFSPDVLKRYYKDWYRPDRMALSIVGPIENVDSLKLEIEKRFSKIKSHGDRISEDFDSLFFHQKPQFVKIERKPNVVSKLEEDYEIYLYYRDSITKNKITELSGIKRLKLLSLFTTILNRRYKRLTDVYNSNFTAKIIHTYQKDIEPPAFKISIIGSSKTLPLNEVLEVLNQFQNHGVSEQEFQVVINSELNNLNSTSVDRPDFWRSEIRKNFFYDEPILTDKLQVIKNWLQAYSLNEFNQFVASINLKMPEDIGMVVPNKHHFLDLEESEIRQKLHQASLRETVPYRVPEIPNRLMSDAEIQCLPKRPYQITHNDLLQTEEVILENGVKLILKRFLPNGVNKNRISIHGFTPNGAMNFPKEDYFSAINAPGFIKNSGLGNFNKFELQNYLSKTKVFWHGIDLYIHNMESGVKANVTQEDFETLLQLLYLYFTKPKVTDEAFEDWKKDQKKLFLDPIIDQKYNDLEVKIDSVINDFSDIPFGSKRYKGLNKTNLKKGLDIYRKLFSSTDEFTFIIAGDFCRDDILPLLNIYLGNLRTEIIIPDKAPDFVGFSPIGPYYKQWDFSGSKEKKNLLYRPLYIIPTQSKGNWKERIRMEALSAVINMKVWNLRFEKGYSLYVTGSSSSYNKLTNKYEINTIFNCIPEEFQSLRDEYLRIISELKEETISKPLLSKALKRLYMMHDPKGRGNSLQAISNNLYECYRFEIPWIDRSEIQLYIKSLTPEIIKNIAQNILLDKYRYEFVMKNN